jgi:hypothetical protein
MSVEQQKLTSAAAAAPLLLLLLQCAAEPLPRQQRQLVTALPERLLLCRGCCSWG